MKRYRGENPSHTKRSRSWLQFQEAWWLHPYRPMKKAGARRKRKRKPVALPSGAIVTAQPGPRYNELVYLLAQTLGEPIQGTVVDSKEPIVYRTYTWTPGG